MSMKLHAAIARNTRLGQNIISRQHALKIAIMFGVISLVASLPITVLAEEGLANLEESHHLPLQLLPNEGKIDNFIFDHIGIHSHNTHGCILAF